MQVQSLPLDDEYNDIHREQKLDSAQLQFVLDQVART
jgi:hypothetical protein